MKKESKDSNKNTIVAAGAIVAITIGLGVMLFVTKDTEENLENNLSVADTGLRDEESKGETLNSEIPQYLVDNFDTDLSSATVEWSEVLSGGPPKDGIPSVDSPKFESISETEIPQDTEGLLLEVAGEVKFYPYNILIRHEIVNDTIGGTPVAVTFCPLCGSGIVFDRTVNGEVTEFGVSGFLRESNMIMYDRATESLWQQALGTSIAGDLNGEQLEFLPVQLSTIDEATASNPEAQILTIDTGIYPASSYSGTPYGNYDEDDDYFIFRPSNLDARFPNKEIFQIVPIDDYSVAIRRENLVAGQTYTFTDNSDIDLTVSVDSNGKIEPIDSSGDKYPTYFEMWFSWAVQHEDNEKTIVWEPTL